MGENGNLVKKNCRGTNAQLLTRRCYNNVSLSDGCINIHSTVIFVCFLLLSSNSKKTSHKISEWQTILLISGMKRHKGAQDLVKSVVIENIIVKSSGVFYK